MGIKREEDEKKRKLIRGTRNIPYHIM